MAKDKIIGAVILVVAALALICYTWWVWVGYATAQVALNGSASFWVWLAKVPTFFHLPWELAIIIPVWLVAVLVLAIAIWIGWSMLTTPPPVPLEELEEELEAEEKEEQKKNAGKTEEASEE
jgi:flagellar basal body-associated protein FliL